MDKKQISTIEELRAHYLNCTGLEQYEHWELESAISLFQQAIRLDAAEPEYYLNLARAYVRLGNHELMQQALRDYIQTIGARITRWTNWLKRLPSWRRPRSVFEKPGRLCKGLSARESAAVVWPPPRLLYPMKASSLRGEVRAREV
jgi:hypothetical protein